jgi:mannitol-1-/sugar-/sorbitol-6-phosphatase
VRPSTTQYRQALDDDLDQLVRIRSAEWGTESYWQERILGYMRGTHHPQQALAPRVILVASKGDRLLGFIAGHLTRRYECHGELEWLNVAPEARRSGIAGELLRVLASWFADQGAKRVCVDVDPENRPARTFYRKHGARDLNPHWLVWPDITALVRPVSSDSTNFTCSAILFDLDGVLVDSRQCVEFVWQTWCTEQGRDPREFIAVAHGRRTSETLHELAPDLDIPAAVARLEQLEKSETRGVSAVSGAAALLTSLPRDRWAIVTSGSPAVARLRMSIAAVPVPPVLITAADVSRGKPDPDGYLRAAEHLGYPPAECLVIEDAPAGVAAGHAAGMRVVAVDGTVGRQELALADHHIPALGHLQVTIQEDGQLLVALRDS